MTSKRGQSGFTLLEMLVVLLIAGMALALTTQALGQYQRAYSRASVSEQAGREYRLSESWFRDSVRSLRAAPDQTGPSPTSGLGLGARASEGTFSGRSDGFTGLTLAPVLAGQGVPIVQQWRVIRDTRGNDALELEEGEARISLVMPGDGRLVFHYLDATGEMHPQWPPALGETWPQLPAGIVLETLAGTDGTGGAVLAAAVIGVPDALKLPYEPEPY